MGEEADRCSDEGMDAYVEEQMALIDAERYHKQNEIRNKNLSKDRKLISSIIDVLKETGGCTSDTDTSVITGKVIEKLYPSVNNKTSSIGSDSLMEARKRNMDAKVGSTISCPVCSTKFTKTTYNKIFCNSVSGKKNSKGKYKNKGYSSCKDTFWNIVENKVKPF